MRKMKSFIAMAIVASLVLGTVGFALAEKQPRMEAALKHLKEAKAELEKASADKGGHRVKAIALIDQAIKQVEKGMEYDNKH